MSNETKRDVFEVALNHATKTGWVDYGQLSDRYAAALPDDLPVIPQYVADYMVYWKEQSNSLRDIILESVHTRMDSDNSSEAFDWVYNHFEKFARVWLDGYEVVEVDECQ